MNTERLKFKLLHIKENLDDFYDSFVNLNGYKMMPYQSLIKAIELLESLLEELGVDEYE